MTILAVNRAEDCATILLKMTLCTITTTFANTLEEKVSVSVPYLQPHSKMSEKDLQIPHHTGG
jgi:hypothetical protein